MGSIEKYLVNYSLVDKVMDFLKNADNAKLLHRILHLTICARHQVQELCSIDVSLPLLEKPKSTTFSGLPLLAFTEGEGRAQGYGELAPTSSLPKVWTQIWGRAGATESGLSWMDQPPFLGCSLPWWPCRRSPSPLP